MALITTPGPDCESLCTVAAADAYHERRGNGMAWLTLDQARKEELLRRAYDDLMPRYLTRWPTPWAFGAIDAVGTVPRLVREANALLALYALAGPLDAPVSPQVTEKTIGPITTKYAKGDAATRREFPDVDRMIAPFLAPVLARPFTIPLRRT